MLIKRALPKNLPPAVKLEVERGCDDNKVLLKKGDIVQPMPGINMFTRMDINEMVPMVHVGPQGCGRIAFYYTHKPDNGEEMTGYRVKLLDNTNQDPYAPFVCDSCGLRLQNPEDLIARARNADTQ